VVAAPRVVYTYPYYGGYRYGGYRYGGYRHWRHHHRY
jgi:hypothetical protein